MPPGRRSGEASIRLAMVALAFAAWSASAGAQELPQAGEPATGTIRVLGKTVSLPPGPWVVAGAGFGGIAGHAPPGFGAIGSVLLVRPAQLEADGFVLIHTNLLPVREGWGQPTACSARDSLFRNGAEPRDGHMSCGYVRAVTDLDPWLLGMPAVDAARRSGLIERLPRAALVAGMRVGDRRDMIDIGYGFRAPAATGPGGWTRETMGFDARRAEIVGQLSAWMELARALAAARLRSEAVDPPPLPQPWTATTAQGAEDDLPAWRLGLYKLLTYRVMSSAESFILAYVVTGNAYTSVVYTFWQGITHSLVFYANEMAWEWPRTLPIADIVAMPREGTHDVVAARPRR
jgi:uncharacterized membrane protein